MRVRVGCALRQAGVRSRSRLADAALLAIPDRRRALLGVAPPDPRQPRVPAPPHPEERADPAGARRDLRAQQRHVLCRARDRAGVPRRAHRLPLSGARGSAVTAVRPTVARPACVARAGDLDDRRGNGRRWDRARDGSPAARHRVDRRIAADLLDLDHPRGAAERRTGRSRRDPRGSRRRWRHSHPAAGCRNPGDPIADGTGPDGGADDDR